MGSRGEQELVEHGLEPALAGFGVVIAAALNGVGAGLGVVVSFEVEVEAVAALMRESDEDSLDCGPGRIIEGEAAELSSDNPVEGVEETVEEFIPVGPFEDIEGHFPFRVHTNTSLKFLLNRAIFLAYARLF